MFSLFSSGDTPIFIGASYQVTVHLVTQFQRRRFKCEKITDDGRRKPSDGQSSHDLWVALTKRAKQGKDNKHLNLIILTTLIIDTLTTYELDSVLLHECAYILYTWKIRRSNQGMSYGKGMESANNTLENGRFYHLMYLRIL